MPKAFLQSVAALGDSAVLGALAVMIGAYLFWTGCRQGWKGFFLSLGVAVLVLLGVKFVLLGCGIKIAWLNLRTQTGQIALMAAVLGSFASLLSSQLDGDQKSWPFYLLIPVILAIEAARVALGQHDEMNAALGLLIGGNIALGVHLLFVKKKVAAVDMRLLLILVLFVVVAFHNFAFQLKHLLDDVGAWLIAC